MKRTNDSNIILETGDIRPGTWAALSRIKPGQLRPGDMDELLDYLNGVGYHEQEIYGPEFGQILGLAMGLHRTPVRTYAIKYVPLEKARLLFLASLTQLTPDSPALMCGFGLEEGYTYLSKRDIFAAIHSLFEQLVTDMVEVFNTKYAVCHVKASNEDTLRMWRFLGRSGLTRDGEAVRIRIIDNPFMRGYKLVTLSLGGD